MRVFLSVAGPDRPKAEEVALALEGDGHRVFLDQHKLPPGESYHKQIRKAILDADLVVFFVSPLSVQNDRYTITELKIIQDKWRHPHGRVLPVMLAPVDMKHVPAYLKAVTICTPKGDLAGAVFNEVSRMKEALEGRRQQRQPGGAAQLRADVDPSMPLPIKGAAAAIGLGALAILVGIITDQLAMALKGMHMPPMAFALFHGTALTLLVWLAALLFNVRNPQAFVGLAAGSIGAYVFEQLAWNQMHDQSIAMHMGQSLVFATLAAISLPGFRNISRWAALAAAGAIAGQLTLSFGYPLKIFVWESLLVATTAFFLALNEYETAHAN